MPICQKIKRKHRKVAIGDLSELITLQNRNIVEPLFGEPDFDEEFSGDLEVWAAVTTVNGKTFFDNVGTEGGLQSDISHELFIKYESTVTAETWVILGLNRLDILKVEDLDGRNEFMRLTCIDRGLIAQEATKA